MWEPYWDHLKSVVQQGADWEINRTSDPNRKETIKSTVNVFTSMPVPTNFMEMMQRNVTAIALQGVFNNNVPNAGVFPNFGSSGFGTPGQSPETTGK
jgi:hypothetical protein